MIINELNSSQSQIIKLRNFKKINDINPKTLFHLIYTFSNNDYLLESLKCTEDFKLNYEIRAKKLNEEKFDIKLKFQLESFNNSSLINDLFIIKYDDYINIYQFTNNNTEYFLKQQIMIDQVYPGISCSGFFIKTIKQNKKYENNNDIIDILIQPNRNIKNYFILYRSDENTKFYYYDKIIINDGDDPGFIFIDEKHNNLLSFVEKATDNINLKSQSYILKYDLFTYKKINSIIIKDLNKFNSPNGFRQELKIYKNSFLFIHNTIVKVFSLDELSENYFQIVNSRNILSYQCSTTSHIDNTLLIAQINNKNFGYSYIKQYILNEKSLELIAKDSIEIKGFIKGILNYIDGYIIVTVDSDNEVKYTLLQKSENINNDIK